MSTQALTTALPRLARRRSRMLRLETVVMGGAIVALIILVVLPLLFLLFGSVKGEQGMSLDHFTEVLSGRPYVNALLNSLILGAWTGLFSLIIGLVLAWAVSRTDVAAKPFLQITATLSREIAVTPPQVAFSTAGEASQALVVTDARAKPLTVLKAASSSPHLAVED